MRILVDYRPALRARTGVGEYIHALVRAYTRAYRQDDVALFVSSWKDRPPPETGAALSTRVIDRRVPVRALNYLWHRWGWPPIEHLAGTFDVVHAAHPLLVPARRAAQIVTIHDLFFLSYPERTSAEIRRDYPELTARHAQRADAIVTSSHFTQREIVTRLGVAADRVVVCPPGAPEWMSLGRAPNVPANGYFLFLGTLEPRKNIGVLLDAYERLLARVPAAPDLVLAGAATESAADWLSRLARAPLRGHARALGYVKHEERETLFAGARCVVMPSLEEGFGLPVLEAMSAGVPVVASTGGALPEVTGGAGLTVDPADVDGFCAAMAAMLDPAFAATRAEAGLARAAAYTWPAAAERLHAAYAAALERRRARGAGA